MVTFLFIFHSRSIALSCWIVGNSVSASVHRMYTRIQRGLWVKVVKNVGNDVVHSEFGHHYKMADTLDSALYSG